MTPRQRAEAIEALLEQCIELVKGIEDAAMLKRRLYESSRLAHIEAECEAIEERAREAQ